MGTRELQSSQLVQILLQDLLPPSFATRKVSIRCLHDTSTMIVLTSRLPLEPFMTRPVTMKSEGGHWPLLTKFLSRHDRSCESCIRIGGGGGGGGGGGVVPLSKLKSV